MCLLIAQPATAQEDKRAFDGADDLEWAALRSAAEVDTTMVGWLERTMDRADATALFRMVGSLSRPEAAQLLGSRFYRDPSFHYRRSRIPLLDSTATILSERPPADTAGLVFIAYHVERLRRKTIGWVRGGQPFVPKTLELESFTASPRLDVRLDFGPARSMLEVISGKVDVSETTLLDDPVVQALYSHRSQSFYAFGFSREALLENLEAAASDRTVDALYRYAFPVGLMHLADVRNRLGSYLALVDTLEGRAADIEAHISGRLGAYVPESLDVERTVHFLFADGADGWAADGVAAIDLEYFRDDYDTLLRLLAHETYHSVQAAAAGDSRRQPSNAADVVFRNTLGVLLGEGTATFVAPPRHVSSDEYQDLVKAGSELMSRIRDALYGSDPPDVELARELLSTGVQSSGPLYWLGAEMAGRIESGLGRTALAETLYGDGLDYVRTFVQASGAEAQDLLARPVVEAVEALRGRLD